MRTMPPEFTDHGTPIPGYPFFHLLWQVSWLEIILLSAFPDMPALFLLPSCRIKACTVQWLLDFVLRTVAGAAPDWNRIPY